MYNLDDDTADVVSSYGLTLVQVDKLIRALRTVRQRMVEETRSRVPQVKHSASPSRSAGGRARAVKLTGEERSAIATRAANAHWNQHKEPGTNKEQRS